MNASSFTGFSGFRIAIMCLLLAALGATAVPGQSPPAAAISNGNGGFRPDRIIVKPLPGVDLSGFHGQLGVGFWRRFPAIGDLQIINLPPGMTVAEALAIYRQSGAVAYAEPDYVLHALLDPNDFRYQDGSLWNLHNTGIYGGVAGADIHAPQGWNIQNTASNIIVAVIDTGVRYTHEDLAANMWINPGESGPGPLGLDKGMNGLDDDGDGYIDDVHGINAITGTGDPNDDYGHGTHVSGTIGGVGNNGVGVVGVAWRVQIMACKFLDSMGNGTISDAITCIDYARSKGARIINASWGSYTFTSTALYDTINSLRSSGIIFVAACGNDANNNDANPLYPASYNLDNVISVAATDRTDTLAGFSNYGANTVKLAAPGSPVFSCWNGSDSDYQYFNGTSMAAPHIAGACALLMARYPNDTYLQTINRVLAATDPLPSLAGKCVTGGRFNLFKALAGLKAAFVANPNTGAAPLTVTFTDTSSGSITNWSWNFGDGTAASAQQNPTHVYNRAGLFTATLTVTDNTGTASSSSEGIAVTGWMAVSPAGGFASSGVQGGPFSPAGTSYTISNHGNAALSWAAAVDQPWVTLSATGGSIGVGGQTGVNVTINNKANLLLPGTNSATVSFSNVNNGDGNTTRTVTLVVNRYSNGFLVVSPQGGFTASGPKGGPFNPGNTVYTLNNTGGASLVWTANPEKNWLTISPSSGVLAPSATTNVTVSFNNNASTLGSGSYNSKASFSTPAPARGNTTRTVTLKVQ